MMKKTAANSKPRKEFWIYTQPAWLMAIWDRLLEFIVTKQLPQHVLALEVVLPS